MVKQLLLIAQVGWKKILNSTGNEAFLAHKGDVRDLTSKIQYLLSDHQNRQNIGNRNSQVVHQVFGIGALYTVTV